MSGTMKNPFFVEILAVQLSENSVFQDPLATYTHEPGNEEYQRTEGNQCDDRNQNNGRQLEVHQVGSIVKDFLPPGAANNGCNGNGYGCKSARREAEKAEP